MNYGIATIEGCILCDPIPFDKDKFADLVGRLGGEIVNIPSIPPISSVECGYLRILPGVELPTPAPNAFSYDGFVGSWRVEGDFMCRRTEWSETKDLSVVKARLVDASRKRRWGHEVAGVLFQGRVFRSDEISQLKIAQIELSAFMNLGFVPLDFEVFPGSWMSLNRDDVLELGRAIRNHVQLCFTNCKRIHDQIEECGSIEEALEIDISLGWPSIHRPETLF